ncbi:MAG: hypothetical protein HOY71_54695, partial [Nonomuraea sp.]|nr:hypothetical protein [Nonomuraea sp.]
MKFFLTGLAVTTAAACSFALPAQAAPADPVKALKAQLVAGKGVKVSKSDSITVDFTANDQAMQVRVTTRTTGTVAFGKGKPAAADLRISMTSRPTRSHRPYRVVTQGRNAYVTNPGIVRALPAGRSWIQSKAGSDGNSLLDVITPADLQFMLKNSSEVATGEYEGTATLAAFRHDKSAGDGDVQFHLYFDKNNLLTRTVVDSTTLPDEDAATAYDQMVFHTDTRYT